MNYNLIPSKTIAQVCESSQPKVSYDTDIVHSSVEPDFLNLDFKTL